jgi:hypothetical protein
MEELIQRLQNLHGLTPEQSHGILNTITNYVKEKFPMVGGAIDNLFQSGTTPSSPGTTPTDANSATTAGTSGQSIEDFAKDKLGSFFGNK